MFDGILMQNFKRFGPNAPWIGLRPLTLTLGRNSAGKTTLTQAMLVLAQTWRRSLIGMQELRPSGDLVDLGTYANVFHHGATRANSPDRGLRLGFQRGAWRFILEWDDGWRADDAGARPVTAPLVAMTIARVEEGIEQWSVEFNAVSTLGDGEQRIELHDADGADVRHLLSTSLVIQPVGASDEPSEAQRDVKGGTLCVSVLISHGDVRCEPRQPDGWPSHESWRPSPEQEENAKRIGSTIGSTLSTFREAVRAISHIGPLRHRGMRLYQPRRATRSWRVGQHGHHMTDVLVAGGGTLYRLNELLRQLGLAYQVLVKPTGETADAYELLLGCETAGDAEPRYLGLPDVGSGVGQILPFLVQLARVLEPDAKPRTVVIIEQPEVHLHPGIQWRLAKVVADAMAPEAGLDTRVPQVIIETHSEHLLYGVGTAIKRDCERGADAVGLKDDVVCLSFSASGTSAEPSIVPVYFAEDGEFMNEWPEGFFPERAEMEEERYGESE